MKTASTIARYLAGVIFLVFGLNGFLNFIPLPPPGGIAGQFMGALYASHYLCLIFALQVIGGVLLLANRYVPLALAILAPVIVNILVLSRSDGPERSPACALRDGTLGPDIRGGSISLCPSIPGAASGRLTNQHDSA